MKRLISKFRGATSLLLTVAILGPMTFGLHLLIYKSEVWFTPIWEWMLYSNFILIAVPGVGMWVMLCSMMPRPHRPSILYLMEEGFVALQVKRYWSDEHMDTRVNIDIIKNDFTHKIKIWKNKEGRAVLSYMDGGKPLVIRQSILDRVSGNN